MSVVVRYLDHSGFAVEVDRTLLIFDYYNDQAEQRDLAHGVVTREELAAYERVAVFVSHSHADHFNPVIYDWAQTRVRMETYLSFEVPEPYHGIRLSPGDVHESNGLTVHAFGSTDLGVSFLVELNGLRVFHAGDLNWWHWREESTPREIEESETFFYKEMEPIIASAKKEPFDIAFFPLDPRQKTFFDAGANYFVHSVKPRIFIPMHTMRASELIFDYARKTQQRGVTVVPMTERGEEYVYDND